MIELKLNNTHLSSCPILGAPLPPLKKGGLETLLSLPRKLLGSRRLAGTSLTLLRWSRSGGKKKKERGDVCGWPRRPCFWATKAKTRENADFQSTSILLIVGSFLLNPWLSRPRLIPRSIVLLHRVFPRITRGIPSTG